MVDEEKVRIMTKIASYEQKESKEVIKEGGYNKSDYIRSHLLVVIWSYSIAYFLLLLLLTMYHLDFLATSISLFGYRELAVAALAVYLLLVFGCCIIGAVYYAARYDRNRRRRKEYFSELKMLETFYTQNKEGGNG